MQRLALALVILTACAEQEEMRSDVIPIYYLPHTYEHTEDVKDEAQEILGLAFDENPKGAAVILHIDGRRDGINGSGVELGPCVRAAWSWNKGHTLAHEIGHALGLEHVDDPNNLMFPHGSDGFDLDEEQIDTMRLAAWWLEHKCGWPQKD